MKCLRFTLLHIYTVIATDFFKVPITRFLSRQLYLASLIKYMNIRLSSIVCVTKLLKVRLSFFRVESMKVFWLNQISS